MNNDVNNAACHLAELLCQLVIDANPDVAAQHRRGERSDMVNIFCALVMRELRGPFNATMVKTVLRGMLEQCNECTVPEGDR